MGLEEQLSGRVRSALEDLARAGELDADLARSAAFTVEPPRRGGAGDVATNVALSLAKAAKKKPRELAEAIAERLRADSGVREVEVAGPGFLNVHMSDAAFVDVLRAVCEGGRSYGRAASAIGERILVEFVSANPTGPLLISHGRGAVIGDAVARLLEAAGHRVVREYYINDFGNQVRLLAESVQAAGRGEDPPEGGYGGYYVSDMATWLAEHRAELLEKGGGELGRECVLLMLEGIPGSEELGIRRTLGALGVEFDVWTSEEALHRWGRVRATLDELDRKGRLAPEGGALVFKTGDEDEKDRVVQKSDGAFTYFASDIAYHDDKMARGFDRMIDVWGADHHGYVARVRSALEALGHPAERFEVLLFQLVSLLRDGKAFKMGKRLGNLITIQEILEEIDADVGNVHAGRDALRFYYLSRKVDTPIKLDVELAKKQGDDNPVFYVQYGHARLCSILRKAKTDFDLDVPRFDASLAARVDHPLERKLVAILGRYPGIIRDAAASREPNRVVGYLDDVARAFQSYYTQGKRGDTILPQQSDMAEDGWRDRWDWEKTRGRLLWVDAIRCVYRSGLELLGIEPHERMERKDVGAD